MSRSPGLLGTVWCAAAAMCAGVVLHASIPMPSAPLAIGAALLIVRRRGAAFAGLVAFAFAGGQLTGAADSQARTLLTDLARDVPRCSAAGAIAEQAGELGTLVRVDRLVCDETSISDPGIVIVDRLEHPSGTRLTIDGWLIPFSDEGFDRARARTGAAVALHATHDDVIRGPTGALALAAAFRHSLVRSTERLETRRGSLLRGLTIGDTSGIDETMESDFRRTGLAHLVAVSGSNVAIVLAGAALLVRRAGPALRSAGCAVVLLLYVLVVGPEPSVLRAAAMGGVALAGILWGRRTEPLQALGLAVIVLVALRPGLVTSVGLHLSAAATAGIVLWARPLAEWMNKLVPLPVAYALGATVAAQVAVAPILIIVFGEVSLVAPLANLLAAVAVAPATVLGLLAGLVGLVSPHLARLLAYGAGPFSAWIVIVAEWLARPAWAAAACPAWVGWALGVPVSATALVGAARSHRGPRVSGLD